MSPKNSLKSQKVLTTILLIIVTTGILKSQSYADSVIDVSVPHPQTSKKESNKSQGPQGDINIKFSSGIKKSSCWSRKLSNKKKQIYFATSSKEFEYDKQDRLICEESKDFDNNILRVKYIYPDSNTRKMYHSSIVYKDSISPKKNFSYLFDYKKFNSNFVPSKLIKNDEVLVGITWDELTELQVEKIKEPEKIYEQDFTLISCKRHPNNPNMLLNLQSLKVNNMLIDDEFVLEEVSSDMYGNQTINGIVQLGHNNIALKELYVKQKYKIELDWKVIENNACLKMLNYYVYDDGSLLKVLSIVKHYNQKGQKTHEYWYSHNNDEKILIFKQVQTYN